MPSADGLFFQAVWREHPTCALPRTQLGPMPSADGRFCFSLSSSSSCLSAARSTSGTSQRQDL
eukprot:3798984-Pyramimonas_sp.AAC.1